ncbi:hypothetical protein MASR1M107_31440 [Ignavibacteriales bacterium]
MQQETAWYRWNIKHGDYNSAGEYDNLYFKRKKQEKLFRNVVWLGVAIVISQIFLKIFAYASQL